MTKTRTGQLLGAAVMAAVALSMVGNGVMGQPGQQADPFIRGGGRRGPAAVPVAALPPQNGGGGQLAGDDSENPMQVYIEDSFAAGEKLTRAMNFERKGQIAEAIEAYQGVIDDYGDKLAKQDTNSVCKHHGHRAATAGVDAVAVKAGAYDDKYSSEAWRRQRSRRRWPRRICRR